MRVDRPGIRLGRTFIFNIIPQGVRCPKAGESPVNTGKPGPQDAGKKKEDDMFAVLKTGGKQYRVQSGDVLRVEKLAAEAGDKVQFNDILMIGSTIGSPLVTGAGVVAEVIDTIKADKVITYHKRRRKHSSQRTRGHRQQLTLLRVTDLLESGADTSDVKAAVGAALARRDAHGVAGEAVANGAAKAQPAAEAPRAEPTRPANLLDAARDGQPDDLKLIDGVGPVLEELLHKNGVYHFDQIVAWNAREIAFIEDQIDFKGRITREKWKQQAKKLAAQKEA